MEAGGSGGQTRTDDFRVIRDNLGGGQRTTRDRLIPYCLFTDPELAHVGLNESEAISRNISYRLAKMPMAKILRTRTVSEPRGFIKALVGDDDRILGCTAFGLEATEIVATVQAAMLGGMPYTALRNGIFTHPTVSEGLTRADPEARLPGQGLCLALRVHAGAWQRAAETGMSPLPDPLPARTRGPR